MPAHIAASQTDPSLHSPSPRITNTRESDLAMPEVKRHAQADTHPVTECAGAGFDAGHLVGVRVAAEDAVRGAEAVEFRLWEEPLVGEDGIERRQPWPLLRMQRSRSGQLRIPWVEAQHVVVQHAQDVDAGKRRAHMPAPRGLQHAYHQAA